MVRVLASQLLHQMVSRDCSPFYDFYVTYCHGEIFVEELFSRDLAHLQPVATGCPHLLIKSVPARDKPHCIEIMRVYSLSCQLQVGYRGRVKASAKDCDFLKESLC